MTDFVGSPLENAKVVFAFMSIDNAIEIASASLEMEGLNVSEDLKQLLRKRINNEISMEDYIHLAMALNGMNV
ncbi:MAG: antitoxin VbhA family protein [Oscillospiraceae bacterium]|nr:antitoxin VbhA family protein [Oscillospiraceae bacterium]MDY2677717.1 antitoxin VbhA family protein [Oscillospiraceae bacterium]